MKLNKKVLLKEANAKIVTLVSVFSKQPLKCFLIVCIVLITLIKLNLIGTGFLAFPDEFRYKSSEKVLKDLSELNIESAINAVFSTQGRPADAILKTIPNAIQLISAKILNLNYYESKNSFPLFLFNFIIYCFILIVHFKFSKLVLKDECLSLISVLLFSSLTNSHIYLRHALPYDASLLVFYLIFYKTVKHTENSNLTNKKCLFLGLFAFLGYLIYPGYFPLYFIIMFLLFFNKINKNNIFKNVFLLSSFVLGSVFSLIIFETMSRFVGFSYIWDAISLSTTITQGSFEESFTFIIKYLFEVEFLTGIIIILSLTLFCFVMFYQFKNKTFKQHSLIILLGISVLGMYLVYASAGYFLHKMVFYGRLLHQYFPFICIMSIFSLNELIKSIKIKQLVLVAISIVFTLNFGINFIHYSSFSYPRDIAWKICKKKNLKEFENVCEYDDSWSVLPSIGEFRNIDIHTKTDSLYNNIFLLNCSYIFPVNDISKYHLFYPKDNYVLEETKPHFINFKAYQYEGLSIVERHNIDKMNLQIKVFFVLN